MKISGLHHGANCGCRAGLRISWQDRFLLVLYNLRFDYRSVLLLFLLRKPDPHQIRGNFLHAENHALPRLGGEGVCEEPLVLGELVMSVGFNCSKVFKIYFVCDQSKAWCFLLA